jgi:hypothetical protein
MTKYALITSITRINVIGLMLAISVAARTSVFEPTDQVSESNRLIAEYVSSSIGEFCFWSGVASFAAESRMVIFEADHKGNDQTQSAFDVLVLLPDSNAT